MVRMKNTRKMMSSMEVAFRRKRPGPFRCAGVDADESAGAGWMGSNQARALAAVSKQPKDANIQSECVELLMSVARQSLQAEEFAGADRTLVAVLRIRPDHGVALRMQKDLAEARTAAPKRIEEARKWLEVE